MLQCSAACLFPLQNARGGPCSTVRIAADETNDDMESADLVAIIIRHSVMKTTAEWPAGVVSSEGNDE